MKTHKLIFPDVLWTCFLGGRGVLPCDVSLTPKISIFSQLIICCCIELDTSSQLRPMRQPNFKKSIFMDFSY